MRTDHCPVSFFDSKEEHQVVVLEELFIVRLEMPVCCGDKEDASRPERVRSTVRHGASYCTQDI